MKRQLLFISLFVLFQVLAFVASGQQPDNRGMAPLRQKVDSTKSKIRVKKALVIGNATYLHGGTLNNPKNDANAMADTLIKLGFDVTKYLDLKKADMENVINSWGKKLQTGNIALFFFAGHGMEIAGQNYLVPVDASPQNELQVKHHAISIEIVTSWMQDADSSANIILLDACRNNPFARSWRNGGAKGGLGTMKAPSGTFIGFAAQPGEVASDGYGSNGLYTEGILTYITNPNLSIDQIFNYVNGFVTKKSEKKQIPFKNSSLNYDFYFRDRDVHNPDYKDTTINVYKPHPLTLKLSVATIGIISGIIASSIKSNFDSKVEQFNTLDKTLPVNGYFNSQSDLDKWNTAYSDAQKAQQTGLLNAMVATSILSLGYELFLLTTKVKVTTRKTILRPTISNTSLGFAITHKF